MGSVRSLRRQKRPDLKPYGFCCRPDEVNGATNNPGIRGSLNSIRSLHECPALRLVAHEIVKRSKRGGDGLVSSRRSSAVYFGAPAMGLSKQGRMRLMPSESEIEFEIDEMRRIRQEEYERDMDRWAEIAENKVKREKTKKPIKCPAPCWYTEFSDLQLMHLRKLEDAMFKDKEEKTIGRTWDCLCSIGALTKTAKVESSVVWKLLYQYSDDSLKFLCEIYKALTGSYFEEEGSRNDYLGHERIILSGIAFLELPKVIVELHKRLPPVEKWSFPPKPKKVSATIPRKMETPYLENLRLPSNWKLYEARLYDWHLKCLDTRRPVAILPKNKVTHKEEESSSENKANVIDDKTNGDKKPEKPIETDDNNKPDKSQEPTSVQKIETDPGKKAPARGKNKLDSSGNVKISDNNASEDKELYPMKTDWTNPQTACPYKYRRLLDKKGPLMTDAEFFSELKVEEKKEFPPGRENLSLNMQKFLLDIETDFFQLTEEADRITGAVSGIVKDLRQAELVCGPCCACAQLKKQHIEWHATQSPYNVIDGVVLDDDQNGQVIGTVALRSPASSVTTLSQPICVASKEKLVKNKILAGVTVKEDGELINVIDGCTKALEHVSTECLHPLEGQIKNVTACECSTNEVLDEQELDEGKYENVCFGKKFRPDEGPTYECPEYEGGTKSLECEDDACGCEEELECESSECTDSADCAIDDNVEECRKFQALQTMTCEKEDKRKICKKCGRRLELSCAEKFSGKADDTKIGKVIVNKCSCDSLSEFLKIDLDGGKCVMPPKEQCKKVPQNEGKHKTSTKQTSLTVGKGKKARKNESKKNMKAKATERKKRSFTEAKKVDESNKKSATTCLDKRVTEETIEPSTPSERSGPYGERTKSEEALPPELTIAYLTKRHPPDVQVEMVPVREGGRACRCRENRNNRKTLIYNIGAMKKSDDDPEPVIDGVHWLTPVPSIRRSEEYIPEYEIYESPYGRPRKAGQRETGDEDGGEKVDEKEDEESRKKGWNNAINDEYLTDFFTSKRGRGLCGDACPKCKTSNDDKPRPLKVVKPVCECAYERKIVKRKEERKKWAERQERLKGMDKEPYLHITEVSRGDKEDEDEEDDGCSPRKCPCGTEPEAQLVISAITMQTPCVTPSSSRAQSNLPFVPFSDNDKSFEAKDEVPSEKPMVSGLKENMTKEVVTAKAPANELAGVNAKSGIMTSAAKRKSDEVKSSVVKQDLPVNDGKKENEEDSVAEQVYEQQKRTLSFFNEAEGQLKDLIEEELKKMSQDFVTVKLPNYHEMPQIHYWISYRVRGMHFTEKYKKKLMEESFKTWRRVESKVLPNVVAEPLELSKKERNMLSFDHALYWKRKISKKQVEFYTKLSQEIINYGRTMWATMEYGKFPHVLFKQAFFTYLPSREKDATVFRIE